jgi:hypothetical protein
MTAQIWAQGHDPQWSKTVASMFRIDGLQNARLLVMRAASGLSWNQQSVLHCACTAL